MSSADELRELLRSTNFRAAAGGSDTPVRGIRSDKYRGLGDRNKDVGEGGGGGAGGGSGRISIDSSTEELAALLSTLDTTLKTPLKGGGGGVGAVKPVGTNRTATAREANESNTNTNTITNTSTYASNRASTSTSAIGIGISNFERLTALSASNTSTSAVAAKVRANASFEYSSASGMGAGGGGLPADSSLSNITANVSSAATVLTGRATGRALGVSSLPEPHTHKLTAHSAHATSKNTGTSGSSNSYSNISRDTYDATVIHYHTEICMRTKLGKYLTALTVSAPAPAGTSANSVYSGSGSSSSNAGVGGTFFGHLAASDAASAITAAGNTTSEYILGIEGQGIGDTLDCFTLVPISGPGGTGTMSSNNNNSGVDVLNNAGNLPLRYGMTVAIRAPSARERYLGLHKDAQRGLGFWRALVGTAEHWTLIKGRNTGHYVGAGTASSSSSSSGALEEPGSRGQYVRQGDSLLLFAGSVNGIVNHNNLSLHLDNHLHALPSQALTIHEGVDGSEARLVYHERHSGIGNEFFQINAFGAQPLPAWTDRPYLTQRFLLQRPSVTRETVLRIFPNASDADISSATTSASGAAATAAVNSSIATQQSSLVRELLSALAGIEGRYIRITAATSASSMTSSATTTISENSPAEKAKASLKDVHFSLDDASISNDHAFSSQIKQLLPLCSQAVLIREFLRLHARPSYGLVSHALASAIRAIFREYDILVAQLEYQYKIGQLSLQRLVFLIQPSIKVLNLFAHISERCWNKMGGCLLDELQHLLLEQGDARNKELVLHLFQHASRPFLHMVSAWIFRGELEDPYKEFMIQEDITVVRDSRLGLDGYSTNYWDNRLLLVHPHIPKILRTVAPRILTAGKYLNVVRGCIEKGNTGALGNTGNVAENANGSINTGGVSLSSHLPQIQELSLDAEGSATALITIVEQSYIYSSRSLLRLLQHGHHLTTHLHSLSRFFLLDHGDFFIQFIDTAENELRNEVKDINVTRIQTLLQQAVSTSTLAADPNKDSLTCGMASNNLIQHLHLIQSAGTGAMGVGASGGGSRSSGEEANASGMDILNSTGTTPTAGLKGIEAFTLDYKVTWPISLVLSKRAMAKYQLLSRLLYFSKHVECRVLSCWIDHQSTKELNIAKGAQQAFLLRQRMIHFIQNFVYYMGIEVIAPRSHEMHQGMSAAIDTDEVLGLHERFLDTCLKECLLASHDQLRNLTKIMTTCLLFADHMTHFSDSSFVTLKSSVKLANATQPIDPTTGRGGGGANIKVNKDLDSKAGRPNPGKATTVRLGAQIVTLIEHRDVGVARRTRLNTQSKYMTREMTHAAFQRILSKFSDTFDTQISTFLDNLYSDSYRQHPQLANLCSRLDYNGFYSSKSSSGNSSGGGIAQ